MRDAWVSFANNSVPFSTTRNLRIESYIPSLAQRCLDFCAGFLVVDGGVATSRLSKNGTDERLSWIVVGAFSGSVRMR